MRELSPLSTKLLSSFVTLHRTMSLFRWRPRDTQGRIRRSTRRRSAHEVAAIQPTPRTHVVTGGIVEDDK